MQYQGVLNWNDIRYFLAVARTGSTISAGKTLRVSQTTVSRRVAALEQALALKLFERLQSGFRLTEAGDALLASAETMESSGAAIEAFAFASSRLIGGRVRITVDEIYSVTILAPLLKQLREVHPEIRIELDTTGEVRDLAAGQADVAIRSCVVPDDPNLVGRKLFPDNFGFYCSAEYACRREPPRGVEELGAHPIIAGGGAGIERAYENWLIAKGLIGSVVMRHSSATGLLAAVKAGAGIAALPLLVAEPDIDLVSCFPPARDNPSSLWLLTHERLRHAPHVRAVIDFL